MASSGPDASHRSLGFSHHHVRSRPLHRGPHWPNHILDPRRTRIHHYSSKFYLGSIFLAFLLKKKERLAFLRGCRFIFVSYFYTEGLRVIVSLKKY